MIGDTKLSLGRCGTQQNMPACSTRTYDYDEQDRLARVEEPGRIVENHYDAADMCVWQRVRFPADPWRGLAGEDEPFLFQFSYLTENGRVRQTDTRESEVRSR